MLTDPFLALVGVRGVLFDLDGTLLRVAMKEFLPAYIDGIAGHIDTEHDPAARQVGILTFRVDGGDGRFPCDFRGSYADLYRLLGWTAATGGTN